MFLTFAVSSWEENVQCLVDIYVQQRFQFEVVVFYASSLEEEMLSFLICGRN